jgi:CHAT domain-containing protein
VRPVLAGAGASALSIQAIAEQLIAEDDWTARLRLLQQEPRLLDRSIARWSEEHGEPLLAALIVRASEVGIDAAASELRIGLALSHMACDVDVSFAECLEVVHEAAAVLTAGAFWLWQLFVDASESLVARLREAAAIRGSEAEAAARLVQLRELVEPVVVAGTGCDSADVHRVLALAMQDWAQVWEALPQQEEVRALESACLAGRILASWFEPDSRVRARIEDLADLLQAVTQRGTAVALHEHRLVLNARASLLEDGMPEAKRAQMCGSVSAFAGDYFQRVGAVWVLRAALEPARISYQLTPFGQDGRARCAANLGNLLADAVQAGLLESAVLAEAVAYQREAYELTPPGHPDRSMNASNLGSRLVQAAQAGVLASAVLAEAVEYQLEAYQLTPPGHLNRAGQSSNLGSVMSYAVQAGVLEPTVLAEAVDCQREAYQLTPPGYPYRTQYASNLGGLLAQAVQAGVLEPTVLAEAVDCQREAYQLTPPRHPYKAIYASNLGNRLAEAAQAGVLESAVLAEAVECQREAYQLTPPGHVDRAAYASDLGGQLAQAAHAGILEPAVLVEAVECQREAYQLTPLGHAERAVYVSNLGNRLADAVRAGVLAPAALVEAVECQREAYQLTPPGHFDHALFASNLGSLLAQASLAGVLEPAALAESVDYHREAYELLPPGHPYRVMCASNLGGALADSVQAGALGPEVLVEAVACQREAYELTPLGHPDRAMLASNLGSRLAQAVVTGVLGPEVLVEAVACQREAYELTPLGHSDRAMLASNLGSRLVQAVQAAALGPNRSAADAIAKTAELIDELWRLARNGVTITHRHRVLRTAQGLSLSLPLMMLRHADRAETVRAVEALRGHLSGGMHAPHLPAGFVSAPLEASFRQAANAYETTQLLAREGLASYAEAAPATDRLAQVVEQVRAEAGLADFGGRPRLTDLCACLPPHAAAIYLLPAAGSKQTWQLEEWHGAAVIVRSDGRTAHVLLAELDHNTVISNVNRLLTTSAAAQQVCTWLWRAIAGPLLKDAGPIMEGVTEWVFVPSGYLGLLPLHAAGSVETGWLDEHITVRVTPSLLALADTETPATPTGTPVAAISAAADLPFLAADKSIAAALISDLRLPAPPTTPDTVLEALTEAPIAVLSGHAVHSATEGPGLDFGTNTGPNDQPTAPRWLTPTAVERLPLRDRQWVFLSACSSGQAALDLPDEAIGLSTAFRFAGFRTIISTTWPVKDSVAFIALALFLQHRQNQPHETIAAAIRHSRVWLRNANRYDLINWLEELTATVDIPAELTQRLRAWWTDCPDPTPYADPQDWAPYTVTGH